MSRRLILRRAQSKHPHDFLEDLALSNEWRYERALERKFSLEIEGFPFKVFVESHWEDLTGYLEIMAKFETVVPERKRKDVFEVLASLSLDTRLGYFSLCPHDHIPFYKHNFLAYPKNPITFFHITDTFEEMISGAEKLCIAMHLLLEENKTSQETVFASLIDVIGEA